MYRLTFIFLFAFFNLCTAQKNMTVEKVFDRVEAYYKNASYYSYTSTYKYYENKLSNKVKETKTGIILKKNKVNYQKLDGVEIVDFGDYNVMINHSTKTFYLSSISETEKKSPIALKYFLSLFDVKKITTDPNFWICRLIAQKKQGTQFREMTIYISKKDYSIVKQIFIMRTGAIDTKAKLTATDAKLEISFTKNKLNPVKDDQLVKRANYFSVKNKNLTVNKKYSKFQLLTL